MRSALLISAGFAMAMAGQALASSPTTSASSNMPRTDAPTQSTPPATSSRTTQPPASSTSPTGSPSDTSATAGSAAAAALTVGEPVKDNTGATIGSVASLSTAANGQQMAVIKMGNDSFQVSSDKLGVADGAATINLSQAQISGMLHPPAGGR